MEPGFPAGLDDGPCQTSVAVRAPAGRVAAELGTPLARCEGGVVRRAAAPDRPLAWVLQLPGQPWSLVGQALSVLDEAGGGREGDLLLRQARAALAGRTPDAARLGRETPVTTAARLSARLGAAAAIWGSDQGPGILGGAFFRDGALELTISAIGTALIDRILAARGGGREAEVMDAVEAYCEDLTCESTPQGGERDVAGSPEELLGAASAARGIVWAAAAAPSWDEALRRRAPSADGELEAFYYVLPRR